MTCSSERDFPSVGGSSEAYSLEGRCLVIIYAFCQLLYPDLDLLLASLRESFVWAELENFKASSESLGT